MQKDNNDDNLELREGQEVRLGIRPNHLNSSSSNVKSMEIKRDDSESITPHNHIKHGYNHQKQTHNKHIAPKINLHPRPESRVSPLKPLPKKRKVKESLAAIRSHKHWHNAKLVAATVLIFLLLFNSQWFISQFMYLFSKPSASQNTNQNNNQQNNTAKPNNEVPQAEVVGPQNEIIIPKIGVSAPLVFVNTNNEADVLVALRDGVVHYYGTAFPGENGNAAFFGHSSNDWWEPGNYKFVFVLLEKLSVGDVYEIHYNPKKYVYKVTSTKVVEPNDLSVLNQTSKPTSTLITCTPPGTSWKRFVVSAEQISPVPTQQNNSVQVSENNTSNTTELPSAPKSFFEQIADSFSSFFGGQEKPKVEETKNLTPQHLPEVN